uniref:Uncharacterized protein n=1 Tax=Anguilla anguilla TaxID=7936 RepID=A0A0E9WIN2_ANGAN
MDGLASQLGHTRGPVYTSPNLTLKARKRRMSLSLMSLLREMKSSYPVRFLSQRICVN